ncbi:nucleolar protein 11 [Galleria mellonella]|uniref:Nucleolar protein 11 n=1 Tax=Galleria mellonella TaxID=7137 RepID=A0A6J1X0U7_GALME|nr:nucleolar protein 11 [Galleria mellonella]
MAKFHNYYVLCPLIDQKSFLGVSRDKDSGNVLVTLGKNVVNKYRLSDQKQVGGWTSKDHITGTVVYDEEQDSYVGVFNNNTIKKWMEDSENLDKVKKYKFPLNILKLIRRQKQPPLIIFSNGNCASLPYAIENRKTYESKSILKEGEEIIDTFCLTIGKTDFLCYVTKYKKDEQDRYEIIHCQIRDELGDMDKFKLARIKVTRSENVYVVGELIVTTNNKYFVYILWNDSKMTVCDVETKQWEVVGTVPWISTMSPVSLAYMEKDHLILFGNNLDNDGAVILVYNVLLGIGSYRYPMKMYSDNAKLYCIKKRILLEATNHIGMLPYVLESNRNLSSLLGSHEIGKDEYTKVAHWAKTKDPNYNVNNEIKELIKYGLTERSICAQLITPLLQKNSADKIKKLLNNFRDIPESVLSVLLRHAINLLRLNEVDITDKEAAVSLFNDLFHNETLRQSQLLNYVLQISFSDALLIPHLRELLTLSDTLFLMSYISHLLTDPLIPVGVEMEDKLCDWCILLMDAFYQQFVMTKDEKVTQVLENVLNSVLYLTNQLFKIDKFLPVLNKLLNGKTTDDYNDEKLSYSIEMMEI